MVRRGNLLRDVNYQDQTPVFREGEARNQSPTTGRDADALRARQAAALDARSRHLSEDGIQKPQRQSEDGLDGEDWAFSIRENVGGITTNRGRFGTEGNQSLEWSRGSRSSIK